MPSPAAVGNQQGGGAPPQSAVPFIDGTYPYTEPLPTFTVTPGATAQDFQFNITPGGFLRGVTAMVTGTGGVLGTGVIGPDGPTPLFSSFTMESIDGSSILYPMGGYAYQLVERYSRPWDMAIDQDPIFSNTINPVFRMRFFNECRATLGCVPNTDARAQYRIRFTVAPLSSWLSTVGTATAPSLNIQFALETYAQPPATTLGGNPIAQVPDGMAMQRYISHQTVTGLSTGDNTIQITRTGNIIRNMICVFRDSSGVRQDLTSDPIRLRIDNTQLLVETRNRRDYEMDYFFSQNSGAVRARPTGVYTYNFFQEVGNMTGRSWLPTTAATFFQLEVLGAQAGGSVEFIIDDMSPVATLPPYLENI
jgi:hypothetical protein